MMQLVFALLVVAWLVLKLFRQRQRGQISKGEFNFWLTFWSLVLVVILSLKHLDRLVAWLGFSVPAIQVLIYLAVAGLFYFIFRVRLRLEKLEDNITKLTEIIAHNEVRQPKN